MLCMNGYVGGDVGVEYGPVFSVFCSYGVTCGVVVIVGGAIV